MQTQIPAGEELANQETSNTTAETNQGAANGDAPTLSPKAGEKGGAPGEKGAKRTGKEDKPPEGGQRWETTSGPISFPSRDLAVTVEQLEALGELQYARILNPEIEEFPNVRQRMMGQLLWIVSKKRRLCHLSLNQAQREVDLKASKRNIILKARQMGITTYVAARFFLRTITQPGTLSVQVAHDQDSAEQIFRIVHRFLENLPPDWRRSGLKTSRANVRQIIFPKLDSEYRVESAADRCAGRGLTIQNLHCSEVARWPHDVAETLAALRAAVPPDGEIFLESTPSGAGGTFYEEWQSAPETGYAQHFFPWWWEESYKRQVEVVNFTDEELELMTKHGLDAGQIAFRREMRSQFRNRFLEEYAENAETCFLSSGNCMFDCEKLEKQIKEAPEYIEAAENGRLQTFLPPVTGKDYIIGVDPAGGGASGDYACAQVIERIRGTQCAELLGHYSPAELGARVATLARKYNHALVAVERNGLGESVIQYLTMLEGYSHLYPVGERAGWVTSRSTRPEMTALLDATLAASPQLFNSKRLLQDCRSFVRYKDGECAAASGAHDDTVMAMAVALIVRERADGKDRERQKEQEPALAALAA
jgi:hypothetical protein